MIRKAPLSAGRGGHFERPKRPLTSHSRAKTGQFAPGPKVAMTPDQGRRPISIFGQGKLFQLERWKTVFAATALPGQMRLLWGLGLRGPVPKRDG